MSKAKHRGPPAKLFRFLLVNAGAGTTLSSRRMSPQLHSPNVFHIAQARSFTLHYFPGLFAPCNFRSAPDALTGVTAHACLGILFRATDVARAARQRELREPQSATEPQSFDYCWNYYTLLAVPYSIIRVGNTSIWLFFPQDCKLLQ